MIRGWVLAAAAARVCAMSHGSAVVADVPVGIECRVVLPPDPVVSLWERPVAPGGSARSAGMVRLEGWVEGETSLECTDALDANDPWHEITVRRWYRGSGG